MAEFNVSILFSFIVYLLVMIGIGLVAFRRTVSLPDYLLGGRSLGRWVTALSAEASDMSGWLLLGLPGYAYVAGYEAGWIALGLFVGTWLNWRLVAPRLRRVSGEAADTLTIPDVLASRFSGGSPLLRVVCAIFILVFFTFYTSSGLVAGGKLFNTVFDLPYVWAVTVGGVVIIVYTLLGGFLAVSWTDLVQGLLMFAALVIVSLVLLVDLGGWGEINARLHAINPQLLDVWTSAEGEALTFIGVLSLLAWGLGYFGQPHILVRFMAIRSVDEIAPARRIAVTWVFFSLISALIIGIAGSVYLATPLSGSESETIFMLLVAKLFHPLVAGVLLAAILAAVMSTADSQLLVASSALSEDLYRALLRPQADTRELIWVGRSTVVMVGIIAYYLALEPGSKVLDLVAYAWAGFGAAFGPVILFSLYWRGLTRNGALAGVLTGGLTVIVWKQLQGGWFDLYEIVPGFVLSVVAIYLVSLLDAIRSQEK